MLQKMILKELLFSGNAPTAVFEAMDLYEKGEMNLKAIVGVPVGFVGAADSKRSFEKFKYSKYYC